MTGNTYYIENIAKRDAKIFFTQARKVAPTEAELQAGAGGYGARAPSGQPSVNGRLTAQARSSSAGDVAGRALSKFPQGKRAVSTKV